MNIHANDRTYPVRTEAHLLPTLAQIERAKRHAQQERLELFRRCGIVIGEDGRIVHPAQESGDQRRACRVVPITT